LTRHFAGQVVKTQDAVVHYPKLAITI